MGVIVLYVWKLNLFFYLPEIIVNKVDNIYNYIVAINFVNYKYDDCIYI